MTGDAWFQMGHKIWPPGRKPEMGKANLRSKVLTIMPGHSKKCRTKLLNGITMKV